MKFAGLSAGGDMVVLGIRPSRVRAAVGGAVLADQDAEVIHACGNAQTGSIRIVGSASDCRSNERPVEWSPGAALPTPQGSPAGEFVTRINRQGQLTCRAASAGTATTTTGGGGGSDTCGDGIRSGSEVYDDGNTTNEQTCSYASATYGTCNSMCSPVLRLSGPVCGDGVRNGSEQCDDGNSVSADSCSAKCMVE
jgi:cysteine-rich repeat protein